MSALPPGGRTRFRCWFKSLQRSRDTERIRSRCRTCSSPAQAVSRRCLMLDAVLAGHDSLSIVLWQRQVGAAAVAQDRNGSLQRPAGRVPDDWAGSVFPADAGLAPPSFPLTWASATELARTRRSATLYPCHHTSWLTWSGPRPTLHGVVLVSHGGAMPWTGASALGGACSADSPGEPSVPSRQRRVTSSV